MAELRSYDPTLAERLKFSIGDLLTGLGMGKYVSQDLSKGLTTMAEFLPISGNILAGANLGRTDQGPLMTGLNAAAAAIPGVKWAGPAIRSAEQALVPQVAKMVDNVLPFPQAKPMAPATDEKSMDELLLAIQDALGMPPPSAQGSIAKLGQDVYKETLDMNLAGKAPTPKAQLSVEDEMAGLDPDAMKMLDDVANQQLPFQDHGIPNLSGADQQKLDKLWQEAATDWKNPWAAQKYQDAQAALQKADLIDYAGFADNLMRLPISKAIKTFKDLSDTGKNKILEAMDKGNPAEYELFIKELAKTEGMVGAKVVLPNAINKPTLGKITPGETLLDEPYEPSLKPFDPFDLTEALANIPATPVDEATRQANRMAGGYTTPLYHGARGPFETNVVQQNTSGFFSTPAPELANMYAGVKPHYTPDKWKEFFAGHNVMPLYADTRNFFDYDAGGKVWSEVNAEATRFARETGKDGVIIRNVWDEPGSSVGQTLGGEGAELGSTRDVVITLNPSKLRSAFAQFDPSKWHLNDLLAGLAGAGIVGPQFTNKEQR